tara:strand:- start:169 stop:405 length:237 start_codon:yes stop_codon:yes gene_type:complete
MFPSVDPKLVFEVFNDGAGGVSARCLNASITTCADSFVDFEVNLSAAIAKHYGDEAQPLAEEVHLVFDQDMATALTTA